MAAELTAGFDSFADHFTLRQVAAIFSITYHAARLLPYDEVMYARLADAKKGLYLSHLNRLSTPATPSNGR